MSTKIKWTPKTYFKKADWASYKAQTKNAFSNATTNNNVHTSEKMFRNIINKASKQHIPAGRIPNILNAMSTQTAKLKEDRDQIRHADPADPRLKDLNDEINTQTKDHRQEKWLEHLEKCGPGTKKLWDTIKSIENHLASQTTKTSNSMKSTLTIQKNLQLNSTLNTHPVQQPNPQKSLGDSYTECKKNSNPAIVITPEQTQRAIKRLRSPRPWGPTISLQ